jgi:glutathione S-transferase
VLTHLEIQAELVLVDLAKGEQKAPDYITRNPNGRVPTLEDDGFVITESHAIMQYLADKSPRGEAIYPKEMRARARVHQWQFWSAHHFQPAIGTLNFEHLIKGFRGLGDPDPKEVARGERLFHECAKVLDAHVTGEKWLAGSDVTLADIGVATTLLSIKTAKLPVTDYPNMLAWYERVAALPAWKKAEQAK